MSEWNKYLLKDFFLDINGKPYLYARFNTYGLRGVQPQKKAVFFPSKILDKEYVIIPKDRVEELEKDIDWKVKFPTAVESIQTKEIDIVPKSVVEEIEEMPLETDKFSLLSQAVQVENDSVIFYQNMMEIFPEWKPVLQDIINEELKHIGQLEALRNESPQVGQKVDEGENEADAQMKGIAVEGVEKMKGQMNYKGLGAKESYYTDAKINAVFEDLDIQISPQKNLKMAKVPEGIGVASEDLAGDLLKALGEANEDFTKDERESSDPEAKEACACESDNNMVMAKLTMQIDEAFSDEDLDDVEYAIETAHADGDISDEDFSYLYGILNAKR